MASSVTFDNEVLIKIGKERITEGDISAFKLSKTISILNDSVDELEKSKILALDEARSNLRNDRREKAKHCLRRKKELELQITKKLNAVLNLETLLISLKSAKTDAEILELYKLGIKALRKTHSERNLDEDSVADVMTMLQEVTEISNDISSGLSQPLDPLDEDELLDELNSILNEDVTKPTTGALNLPEVPSSTPSTVKGQPTTAENALSA